MPGTLRHLILLFLIIQLIIEIYWCLRIRKYKNIWHKIVYTKFIFLFLLIALIVLLLFPSMEEKYLQHEDYFPAFIAGNIIMKLSLLFTFGTYILYSLSDKKENLQFMYRSNNFTDLSISTFVLGLSLSILHKPIPAIVVFILAVFLFFSSLKDPNLKILK
jgi:hypothetical protein